MGFEEDFDEAMEVDSEQPTGEKRQHMFPGESSKSKSRQQQLQSGSQGHGKAKSKGVRKQKSNVGSDSRPPRMRRQNRRGVQYVLEMAELGGDDDDDDDDEEDEENAYPQERYIEKGKSLDKTGDTEKFYVPDPLSDESDEDYEEEEEEKQDHQHPRNLKHIESDDETADLEDELTLSKTNPVLFMVKCQRGRELEAAVCLMQKHLDLKAVGRSLQVFSAVALEHQKGCIYVEAKEESHVRQACRGLHMINSVRTTVVPSGERADILSVVKSVYVYRDDWVRLKMGIYKGDLGKVLAVDNVRQRVTVKLVPRIDLQEVCAKMLAKDASKPKRMKSRPQQEFISIDGVKLMGIPVKCKQDKRRGIYFEEFAGKQIQDGYHVKDVALNSLETRDVTPTLDEIQKFQKPGTVISSESLLIHRPSRTSARHQFAKGDAVLAGNSNSQQVIGFVQKVEGEHVFVRAKGNNSETLSRYNTNNVKKYFKVGEHVSVISGKHQGATGMIVDIDENNVIIVSDTSREDLHVLRDCIAESFDVAAAVSKLGEYGLDDLVLLDKTTVGVVVRVSGENFQILKGNPDRVEVITVKERDVLKKVDNRQGIVQDANMNSLYLTNMVRVAEGLHKGKQGRVQHIYGQIIFLQDNYYLENRGLICIRAMSCTTLGGFSCKKIKMDIDCVKSPSDQNRNRSFYNSRSSDQGDEAPRRREGGQRGEDELRGKIAVITKGPYKCYRGRVVRSKDTTVLIYLESIMRVVTVRRHELSVTGLQPDDGQSAGCGLESEAQKSSFNEDNAWGDKNDKNALQDDDGWGSSAVKKNESDWGNNQEAEQDGWGGASTSQEVALTGDDPSKKENNCGSGFAPKEDGWGCAAVSDNVLGNGDTNKNEKWGDEVTPNESDSWGNDGAAQKNDIMRGNNQEAQLHGWENVNSSQLHVSPKKIRGGDGGTSNEEKIVDVSRVSTRNDGWGNGDTDKKGSWENTQETQEDGWGNLSCSKQNASPKKNRWGDGGASNEENIWDSCHASREDGRDSAAASKDCWKNGDTNKDNVWSGSAAQKSEDGWGGNQEIDLDKGGNISSSKAGHVGVSIEDNVWGNYVVSKEAGWGSAATPKEVRVKCDVIKKDDEGCVAILKDDFCSITTQKDENCGNTNQDTDGKWEDKGHAKKTDNSGKGAVKNDRNNYAASKDGWGSHGGFQEEYEERNQALNGEGWSLGGESKEENICVVDNGWGDYSG